MEGTHRPTKIASTLWPAKKVISENNKEREAAIRSNLSVSVNFANIAGFRVGKGLLNKSEYDEKATLRERNYAEMVRVRD